MPIFPFHRCLLILSLATFVGTAVRGPAQAVVYDLAANWSDVNNPNGTWRLNKAPGQLFAINQADFWSDGTAQRAWADQPFAQNAHVPFWMKVSGSQFGGFASGGTIVMHTAESGRTGTEFSSVTWTSPGDGLALLAGGAWMSKSYDRPQRWELRLNGVSLTLGDLTVLDPYTQSNPFSFANGSGGAAALDLSLHSNDVIKLLLYRQSGATPGTSIGLNFSVSFTPIPEPGVAMLLSLGLVAGAVARRLRRDRRSQ